MAVTTVLTGAGATPWFDLGAGPGLKVFGVEVGGTNTARNVTFETKRWLDSSTQDADGNAAPILQSDGVTEQSVASKGYMIGRVFGRRLVRAKLNSLTGTNVSITFDSENG